MDEKVPSSIGRYRVERLLGAGAMGRVFLADDPELDRPVAIKTLKELDLSDDAQARFVKRFQNEARAAARVQHPNIVQVYDVGEDEDLGPYLVFEYVPGESLKEVLRRRGALPLDEACALVTALASGLDMAHAAKIVHRDIKPDNILITEDGVPKLADFGVARVPDAALTREGQFLGTPAYAAPETLGHGQASSRSDLFSLASVMFEVIAGRRTFPGQGAVEVAHRVINDTPPPLSRVAPTPVPRAADRVFSRALSKDPSARYASASELAAALSAAVSGRVIVSGPITLADGVWAPILIIVIGGALIAAALYSSVAVPADAGHDALDASTSPGAEPSTGRHDAASSPSRAVGDARVSAEDASASADAALDPTIGLTPHERDEIAKDEVTRARAFIREGDARLALDALTRAELHDPGNTDIAPLRREAQALFPPSGGVDAEAAPRSP